MIERVNGPQISNDFDLRIKGLKQHQLENGLQVFEINTGTQDIIKIDLVFRCGRIHENKVGASKAAFALIREGNGNRSSQELAYSFDFYGASVKLASGIESSTISLVCLTRYFKNIWPIWFDMINSPTFNLEELEKYKSVQSQKMADRLSKNDILSYRLITEHIFGSEHPYGYNTEPEDIKALKREDVVSYFDKNCLNSNRFLILSGHYGDEIKKVILDAFGKQSLSNTSSEVYFPTVKSKSGLFKVSTQNEGQTSIKSGTLWVSRFHEDKNKLKFLNTVLGGYFGSRLMKNIREQKGYTYGIFSSFEDWAKEGIFYISTDVGNDFIEPTLEEIKKEINTLKTDIIPEAELSMVRNYILGQTLHLIDGPFATAQLVKSLISKNLTPQTFENNISAFKNIQSSELIEAANKYLNYDDFVTVLVGKF